MAADITRLLLRWNDGDREALDQLLPLVYDQLKQLAHARLRGERVGHTLNATALVHEAYLKLVVLDRIQWKDRLHFLAVASGQMRRLLINYAHRRKAQKRGGIARQVPLDEVPLIAEEDIDSLLELNDALEHLARQYPRHSRAVELYYFAGMTLEEAGDVLGVSPPTVMRDLRFARTWMARVWRGDFDMPR